MVSGIRQSEVAGAHEGLELHVFHCPLIHWAGALRDTVELDPNTFPRLQLLGLSWASGAQGVKS